MNVVAPLAVAVMIFGSVVTDAAADDLDRAAEAFDRGHAAMQAGDAGRAAVLFELADRIAPSAASLRNATRARFAARQPEEAATLAVELERRYPGDRESSAVARLVLSELGPELARLELECPGECAVIVDGRVLPSPRRAAHAIFVRPGAHAIRAEFGGELAAAVDVQATAGTTETIRLVAPPAPRAAVTPPARPRPSPLAAAPADRPRGLRPRWVILATTATVALGAGTAISGWQVVESRKEVQRLTAAGDDDAALQRYIVGREQQTRTNFLLGTTAVAGIATLALALWTDCGAEAPTHRVSVAPAVGGWSIGYDARF